jgi:hypothetical protein
MKRVRDPWALSAEEPDLGEVQPNGVPAGCARCWPVCVSVNLMSSLAASRPKD